MSQLKAIIINPDSTWQVNLIESGLNSLQTLVGGYIEAVSTDDGTTIFINEEGKLDGLADNPLATALWWTLAPHMTGMDYLVGTAVVLGPVDDEGDETGVTSDTIKAFADVAIGEVGMRLAQESLKAAEKYLTTNTTGANQ